MASRQATLKDLISFDDSLSSLRARLLQFGWDSNEDLVFLSPSHIRKVLSRFLDGEISKEDVCEWANLVEVREDIGFTEGDEDQLKELIFELANPEITHELDANRASELVRGL